MSWDIDFLPENYRAANRSRHDVRLRVLIAFCCLIAIWGTEVGFRRRIEALEDVGRLAQVRADAMSDQARQVIDLEVRRSDLWEQTQAWATPLRIRPVSRSLDALLLHRGEDIQFSEVQWTDGSGFLPDVGETFWIKGVATDLEAIARLLDRISMESDVPPLRLESSRGMDDEDGQVQVFRLQARSSEDELP